MIRLILKNTDGTFDVTQLVSTITWSGDYQQCARTLEFDMLASQADKSVPVVKLDLGAAVTLMQDNNVLFMGMITTRQKSTNSSTIDITAYDNGIRLKNITASYSFTGQTPEAITRRICSDYGIQVGGVSRTDVKIKRNFFGVDLYKIIQTVYTLASQKNQKKYHIVFRGQKLCVEEKKVNNNTLIIENSVNLMDASMTDSVENMVNQVVIYNENDKLVKTIKNDGALKLYGLMQSYVKQSESEDAVKIAQKLLDDNGVDQKITLNCLGNIANITGGTVVVHEPFTGIYGLFYIDSDVHTWSKGQYSNKLVVNFKNIMDEQEAGALPNKTGSMTSSI